MGHTLGWSGPLVRSYIFTCFMLARGCCCAGVVAAAYIATPVRADQFLAPSSLSSARHDFLSRRIDKAAEAASKCHRATSFVPQSGDVAKSSDKALQIARATKDDPVMANTIIYECENLIIFASDIALTVRSADSVFTTDSAHAAVRKRVLDDTCPWGLKSYMDAVYVTAAVIGTQSQSALPAGCGSLEWPALVAKVGVTPTNFWKSGEECTLTLPMVYREFAACAETHAFDDIDHVFPLSWLHHRV